MIRRTKIKNVLEGEYCQLERSNRYTYYELLEKIYTIFLGWKIFESSKDSLF